ncbi:MAG: DUF6934 family protein [Chitinophagales bacterium]
MSHYNRYTSFDISTDATVFEFISTGPKGDIKKIIQFTPTKAEGAFNLAFGNINDDGSIDDTTANDNKDRDKILATVAAAVYDFTERFPDRYIFFTGSTKERTRLYRMALTLNYEELAEIFGIWGLTDETGFEPFEKRRSYTGFLIKRK